MATSPPCAPHSPSGMGSWVFPVTACLGGIPESPQGLCAMLSLSDGSRASAGNVFFSFSPSTSSRLLSGRAAELRETGAVCLLGVCSWGMAVGFVDFSELMLVTASVVQNTGLASALGAGGSSVCCHCKYQQQPRHLITGLARRGQKVLRNNSKLPKGALWVPLASPLPGSSTFHRGLEASCSVGCMTLSYISLLPRLQLFQLAQAHAGAKKQIKFLHLSTPDSAFLQSALCSRFEITGKGNAESRARCPGWVLPIRYSHRDAGSALSAHVGRAWLWQKALWVTAVVSSWCPLTHSPLYPCLC